MARVAQELAGRNAESAGPVAHALAPRALVDDTVRRARVGQMGERRQRQLDGGGSPHEPCGPTVALPVPPGAKLDITCPSRTPGAPRGLACGLPLAADVTTMLDWISLGAGLLLGILALLALVLTVIGVSVLGRGLL